MWAIIKIIGKVQRQVTSKQVKCLLCEPKANMWHVGMP